MSLRRLLKRLAADLYFVVEKIVVIVVTEETDEVHDDEHDVAKIRKGLLLHSAMSKLWQQRCADSDSYRREGNPLIFSGRNKTCRIQLGTAAFAAGAIG